jgi:signal transduction histidine kinase
MQACEHYVQFYESDAFLLDAVGTYIGDAVRAGDAGIVIATRPHLAALAERLSVSGLDLANAQRRGQYVPVDATETLDRIMVDGLPDADRFAELIGGVTVAASHGQHGVRVFGEMVALLVQAGNHAAALRLEELWNDSRQTRTFSLFCAYPMDSLSGEAHADLVDSLCAVHSRVVPAESYTSLHSRDLRDEAIAALQQRARWLESEIAERKRVEEQLQSALAAQLAARAEAEAAVRARDEFLAIAAHELRNPLTIISGRAQLALRRLRRGEHHSEHIAAEAFDGIARQTSRLSGLIDRLLIVSRLETGTLSLEMKPADVVNIVEQAVSEARLVSDRHVITVTTPPALEALVDPLRLEQALANLLDNAIRHTRDGEIDVVLSQPSETILELSVRDSGPGIAAEERDRIFDRFYQAGSNGSHGGLGLGLFISQQIIERHGGEIRAEFPADGGTRIVVSLPIVETDAAASFVAD